MSVTQWYDPQRLLVRVKTGNAARLALVDAATWKIADLGVDAAAVSPDGRWGACYCTRGSGERLAWRVFPLDRPADSRELQIPEGIAANVLLRWLSPNLRIPYLDTLRLVTPTDTVAVGVPHRIWVDGRDAAAQRVSVPMLSWSSDAPTIADVDDSGVVTPRQAGEVTIHATAGGWRDGSVRLVVGPREYRTVLHETWSSDFSDRWRVFGDPVPRITELSAGVRAFWNHGDGWFHSGAYSRQRFDATRGLGIEVRLSTPIVGPRGEELLVGLASWLDSATLAGWDHRTGAIPQGPGVRCAALVPGGEQEPRRHQLYWGIAGPESQLRVALTRAQLSGAWWTVRLQILPDGRCEGSIDGHPVVVSTSPVPLDRPFGVVLQGNSVGTKMLVGSLEVWEGVRAP